MGSPAIIDPDGFSVFHVDPQHTTASVGRPGMPYAELFFASARKASAFDERRRIRAYAHDILVRGFFDIISPRTGQRLRSGNSLVLNDKSVFFAFPDEPDLLVAAGNLGRGFPICAAIGITERTLISNDDPVWGIRRDHLGDLQRVIALSGWTPGWPASPPTLVSGDADFAHHAWNQLPCLVAALSITAAFDIISTHEPLGPLPTLLPGMSPQRVSRTPGSWLDRNNAPGRLFVPAGSTLLTREVRDAVLAQACAALSPPAAAILARLDAADRPVIWISLRAEPPTPVNQIELIVAVCAAFLERHPDGTIILDGHSLQSDLESNPGSYDAARIAAAVRDDQELAARITDMVGRPDNMIAAIGLAMPEAVALGQHAGFYFCHHGASQRKIGWFSSVPGVVHAGRAITLTRPEQWTCDQSELARRPSYVPDTMVEDVQAPDDPAASFRSEDYLVTDVRGCVTMVLNAQDSALADTAAEAGRDDLTLSPAPTAGFDYVIEYNTEIKTELAQFFLVAHLWDAKPLEALHHSSLNPAGCNAHLSSHAIEALSVEDFLQILFSAAPRFGGYGHMIGFARAFLRRLGERGDASGLVDITNYIFKRLALSPSDLPALLTERVFRLAHELHYWANIYLHALRSAEPDYRLIPRELDAVVGGLPRAGFPDDVVFIFLTANYLQNLVYWLDLYRRHDPHGEHLLVLAIGDGFDEPLGDWLRARGADAARVLSFNPAAKIQPCGNGTGLDFIWYIKVYVAAALVQRGIRVTYSDLDAYWIKNYFAARDEVNREFSPDMIVSLTQDMPLCVVQEQGFTPCAGFFSVEPTASGKALMAEWCHMTEVMFDDQIGLAELLFRHNASWDPAASAHVAVTTQFRTPRGIAARIAALRTDVARRVGLPVPASIGDSTIWHPRWVMAPDQHREAIERIAASR